jgi:small subunit ribosomal protein S2
MGSNMAPYIYMERNGIHIINLYKSSKIEEANDALKKSHQVEKYSLLPKNKQKTSLLKKAKAANMPYITERWPGGMLTNFVSVKLLKKTTIDKMKKDGTFMTLSKKSVYK